MKLSKGQEAMIEDGLPASCIISQEDRGKAWEESPPRAYNPSYMEKSITMTRDEIALLFYLKDSKERGSASLGCSGHIVEVAVLEKLGYAKQHGFGPTSFCITEAGLKEAAKHTRPEAAEQKAAPEPLTQKTKRWSPEPASTEKAVRPPKAPKAPRIDKVEKAKALDLSAICIECGVSSKNRSAALDFLFSKIGKMQTNAAVMKAVYGNDKASAAATDTVVRSLQRDMESGGAKNKYEVRRVKDTKGVYSYGVYKK